jgi:hypothetical protein
MQEVKTRYSLLVAAAAAVLLTVPASASVTFDNPRDVETTVVVRNYNSLDVQVFAVTESGKRFELGTVNQGAERTFALPGRLTNSDQPFQLKVYSLARAVPPSLIDNHVAGVKSRLLSPKDGDQIVLNIRTPLVESFIDRGVTTP